MTHDCLPKEIAEYPDMDYTSMSTIIRCPTDKTNIPKT